MRVERNQAGGGPKTPACLVFLFQCSCFVVCSNHLRRVQVAVRLELRWRPQFDSTWIALVTCTPRATSRLAILAHRMFIVRSITVGSGICLAVLFRLHRLQPPPAGARRAIAPTRRPSKANARNPLGTVCFLDNQPQLPLPGGGLLLPRPTSPVRTFHALAGKATNESRSSETNRTWVGELAPLGQAGRHAPQDYNGRGLERLETRQCALGQVGLDTHELAVNPWAFTIATTIKTTSCGPSDLGIRSRWLFC